MVTFTAYRFGDTLLIDKSRRYRAGEILCEYLNADLAPLEEKRAVLADYAGKLQYPRGEDKLGQYIVTLRVLHRLMSSIRGFALSLPPYSALGAEEEPELVRYVAERAQAALPSAEGSGPAGPFLAGDNTAVRLAVTEINNYLKSQHKRYADYCDDVLRVKHVFREFLDSHLHTGVRTGDSLRTAESLKVFSESRREASGIAKYLYFTPIYRPYNDYEVLEVEEEDGSRRRELCEVVRYYDAGSFLAQEFFGTLGSGRPPRRCTCCGRFFVPAAGYGSEFCERVAPGEEQKSCREVGARKKYDEKVRNNPIWRIYQRAYKTHYARYMKKKLSQEEFEDWSKYASSLRESMNEDELLPEQERRMSIEEYETLIRK